MVVHAWHTFVRGKALRHDVQTFAFDLEANLESLYQELVHGVWRHGPYRVFVRCDPKRRVIAVPSIRDQVIHHLLVQEIGPTFERYYHPHSYASRPGRGVRAAVETVHRWIRDASDGGLQQRCALRMDIASYFASVDHDILATLLARRIRVRWQELAAEIIGSYGEMRGKHRCGIPLGNLTSQLFANVYLHELDHFVAHELRVRRYARYMDDWIVVGRDRSELEEIAMRCRVFLRDQLRLDAPDRKTSISPTHRGVDWLGFVLFPHHRVLRRVTMRRMRQRMRLRVGWYLDQCITRANLRATIVSYDGMLQSASHGQERERLRLLERCV